MICKWWLKGKFPNFVLTQRSACIVSPFVQVRDAFILSGGRRCQSEIERIVEVVGRRLRVVSLEDFTSVLWKGLEEEMWLVYSYSYESAEDAVTCQ